MNSRDEALLEDLANEVQALSAMLATLSPDEWSRVTPAPGWNVADQVIHL
ncbi:MAG: Mycothiol maleylpyruvate isomerase N-terminal domain, partial [Actinomycetota bacterium]